MAAGTDITLAATSGRTLRAYLAADDPSPAPGPAVLVIHEAFGLNDDMRRIADRFAANGYTALAPDLFGPGFTPLCIARFVRGMGAVGTGRPYRELAAFQDWLGRQPGVDPARIGVVGFCMGGGFALLYAARGGRPVRAVAPFYGQAPGDDVVPDLCPVVASYGGRDRVFGETGPKLQAALDAAGIPNDVKTYPDAGHSFMSPHTGLITKLGPVMPTRMGYDEVAAEDAWSRMLAFFAANLAPEAAGG